MNTVALCWVCNLRPATTREHRAKRSDLKRSFGDVSPSNRLFLNSPQVMRNKWVQSLDSDLLKTRPNLCEHCNSTLTQPHDLAWDRFASYVDLHPLKTGDRIRLNKVFPYDTSRHALNVHLYLAKKLGGELVDFGYPDLARPLGEAIRSQRPCPHLYIRLLPTIPVGGRPAHGQTSFEGDRDATSGDLLWGSMEHWWPSGSVQLALIKERPDTAFHVGLWHPRLGRSTSLRVAEPDRS